MIKPALMLLAAALPAAAHEFWIEPSSFQPRRGEGVALRLFVGDGFPGEAYARNPAHLHTFQLVHGRTRTDIAGRNGLDPAGGTVLRHPGVQFVVYRSRPHRITLPPKKFEAYLEEEGLEFIRDLRKARGESHRPGVELYSRCAKALLNTKGQAGTPTQILGLPLELIPKENPALLRAGGLLPVRVLYDGAPLRNALVRAFPKDRKGAPLSARTNAKGEAVFTVPRAGIWMLGTVHMRRAREGTRADWESLWSTLTFEIPARNPQAETRKEIR